MLEAWESAKHLNFMYSALGVLLVLSLEDQLLRKTLSAGLHKTLMKLKRQSLSHSQLQQLLATHSAQQLWVSLLVTLSDNWLAKLSQLRSQSSLPFNALTQLEDELPSINGGWLELEMASQTLKCLTLTTFADMETMLSFLPSALLDNVLMINAIGALQLT